MHNCGFLDIRSTFNLIGGFVVSTGMIVMLVILAVLIIALVALYFFGKKAEKKQAEQKAQMDAMAQTMNMLIIDKGKMKLKDAGFPSVVIENTPKYLRRSKVPVVKAKVGPKIMSTGSSKERSQSCCQRNLHYKRKRCSWSFGNTT